MTDTGTSTAVRITAYGALSAAGLGGKALNEAVQAGALPYAGANTQAAEIVGEGPLPPLRLFPVPDFNAREHLGRKGLSSLSRTATLGMSACALALEGLEEPVPDAERSATGVVLGTSTGSARAFAEFFRDTYEQELPYFVSPALFPGILLNHAASQVAMRNAFTGVNASLAGGQISALSALRYARNALLTGQATRLLTGAMEELSAQSVWAWRHGGAPAGHPIGEGSAVFVLERGTDGPQPSTVAELLACEVGFTPVDDGPHEVADTLAGCIMRALAAGGVKAAELGVVSVGATGVGGWSAVETRGRRRALEGCRPLVLRVQEVLGETYSASGALQLAALLAHWETDDAADVTRFGLVTSVGADGSVAAALLRRPRRRS
ncbi:beta-ketoacyl synthase N-terminal-like domain-containing protein [Streptomyces sp. NPDC048275]|uniref:beta-ketoacyl synthase N-terminal-like domain-containing protein n=1 Tax=Streptomyces sp. NPDC048275 TaxID=3155629 RepID=UPI00340165F1